MGKITFELCGEKHVFMCDSDLFYQILKLVMDKYDYHR